MYIRAQFVVFNYNNMKEKAPNNLFIFFVTQRHLCLIIIDHLIRIRILYLVCGFALRVKIIISYLNMRKNGHIPHIHKIH